MRRKDELPGFPQKSLVHEEVFSLLSLRVGRGIVCAGHTCTIEGAHHLRVCDNGGGMILVGDYLNWLIQHKPYTLAQLISAIKEIPPADIEDETPWSAWRDSEHGREVATTSKTMQSLALRQHIPPNERRQVYQPGLLEGKDSQDGWRTCSDVVDDVLKRIPRNGRKV